MQTKRADSKFLENINKFYGTELVNYLQKQPLISLTAANLEEAMSDTTSRVNYEEWSANIPTLRLPFEKFCFLFEQPVQTGILLHGHFDTIDDDSFVVLFAGGDSHSVENNPNPLIGVTFQINTCNETKSWDVQINEINAYKNPKFQGVNYDKIDIISEQLRNNKDAYEWANSTALVIINQMFRFFKHLEISDHFPIEISSENKKNKSKIPAKHKTEPWRRLDLPTIIYLNDFPQRSSTNPGEQKTQSNTKGSPKKAHPRRGFRRTLSHEKYKKNEFYMIPDAIAVPASWIGDKQSIVNGTEYRVLDKTDIETKIKRRKLKSQK